MTSLWLTNRVITPMTSRTGLSGEPAAEVVVVGAGITGLITAVLLARAGHNGLVAAANLADAGGAVRSAELIPGYISDLCSAFYPMSVASPAIRALSLEDHGLRWTHAPAVVGHPRNACDDDAPIIYRDPARTANDLARRHKHDGDNWCRLVELWNTIRSPLLSTLFAPFPPLREVALGQLARLARVSSGLGHNRRGDSRSNRRRRRHCRCR